MGKPTGFLEFDRELPKKRDLKERINDYNYVLAGRLRSCWSPDQRSVRFIKMQLVTVLDESRFYRFWFYRVGGQATHNNLGRNFAAGMSGGVAYVWDVNKAFVKNCNMEMVLLDTLESEDEVLLRRMIFSHQEFTQSKLAAHILSYWQTAFKQFIKVMPIDYKAVLEKKRITQLTIK